MAQARKPQDRQQKQPKGNPSEPFEFEHDGETYTLKPTYEVLTPGFLRKNRRRDEADAFFTMIEELVDDYDEYEDKSATLDAIDGMTRGQFRVLQKDFYAYLEVSGQGE